MSGPDAWMPLYPGDYLADTGHLNQAQHGGYLLLLMAMWRRDGRVPDDDQELAAITRSTAQEWKKLRPVLQKLCTVENGFWTQRRLLFELAKANRRYQSKVENGRKGGRRHGHATQVATTPTPSDRLATGSDSLSPALSDGGVQPQSQPQPQKALGVVPDCPPSATSRRRSS